MRMINLLQTTYLNPGIVSAESSLCATIHWGSSCVCLICVDWLLPPVNILYINYDLTLDGRADLQFNYFTPMNSMNLTNLMTLMNLINLINLMNLLNFLNLINLMSLISSMRILQILPRHLARKNLKHPLPTNKPSRVP